ncbi:MAG: phosphodiester glycosidase family protein [Clostridia bacterium]|nr:phosphodiester glycosidase family protein [Clostridia bacterium]
MKKLLLLLLCFCMIVPALAEGNEYSLPVDFSGGYKAPEENYTQDTYEDASLSVRMEKRDIDGVRYDIAWIKVASPTQLRTAVAGAPNEVVTKMPGAMSRSLNAVVAINGDFYTQRKDGLIYRQGVPFRYDLNHRKDVLVIDEAGDLHVFLANEERTQEMMDFLSAGHTIINAFTFGPALVKNGEFLPIPKSYSERDDGTDRGLFDSCLPSPRMVIAQMGPLEYVFVEAEGRNAVSKGVTTDQMGQFMITLGVETAYCVDGGNSCIMFFHGRYYDSNYKESEREQSDIIYVCSAVPN